MDDTPHSTVSGWIPELKSILALFFGLFCVLCFKKLIVFGRRWKNIIIDWGYRSINVPSLWIADALSHGASSNRDLGPPVHLGLNVESARRQFCRVPALRLPDAWPNFLLTWMYLNLSTMSSLLPAWIAAINDELNKATAQSNGVSGQKSPRSKGYRLELQSVLPESMPPRLSVIETSASGSTKELHFRCTFSSPCVSLQTELTAPGTSASTDEARRTTHVLRLQNNACRVQLICAALEGGYVLLSWKLISPLIVNRLALLTLELKTETRLSPTDARWIKDTLYQAIQSAVPRLILSPFCVTPVQKLTGDRTVKWQSNTATAPNTVDSNQPSSLTRPGTLTHPLGCRCLVRSDSFITRSVQIRLLSAILLEPLDSSWLSLLRPCAWRCQLRSNAPLGPGVHSDADQTSVLAVTPAAYLQSRSWPSELSHSGKPMYPLDTSSSSTSAVVWNFDALVSTRKLHSDLLDVLLYTDPDPEDANTPQLSGHAVLPLAPSTECCAQNQHVVLVDCHFGPSDATAGFSNGTTVRSRKSTGPAGQPSVKFMLTLKVEMSSVDCGSTPNDTTDAPSLSHSSDWLGTKSPTTATTPPSVVSTPNEAYVQKSSGPLVSSLLSRSSDEPSVDPLTPELISEFMSKPKNTFEHNGSLVASTKKQHNHSSGNESASSTDKPKSPTDPPGPDRVRSQSGQNPARRDPPESPQAIHGPILYPHHSASIRSTNPPDWPDLPPSPSMGRTSMARLNRSGLTPTPPPKKSRRFFRFRSNTTSSRGTLSSREQINSEPVTTNGISNFVEGFIEPSMAMANVENHKVTSSGRRPFASRLQRLFRRSGNRRRKSYDHVSRSQSFDRHLVSASAGDSHSIH